MVLLFSLTLALSAFLLFLVQPMIAKVLLPAWGGTPNVWNTCVLFFQGLLLAGYFYAHLLSRMKIRAGGGIHATLIVGGLCWLPIRMKLAPGASGGPLGAGDLLVTLLASVAVPAFLVSTTAPLLQSFFSRTDAPSARDPYFLYAASNVGSIGALVAYPLFIEPHFPLVRQSLFWFVGYVALAALLVTCVVEAGRREIAPSDVVASEARPPVTWAQCAWWFSLSAIPSSLMLGVTTQITTEVAPIPLLWVVPLTIYLLTYIIAFAKGAAERTAKWMGYVYPVVLLYLAALFWLSNTLPPGVNFGVHLSAFTIAALLCHSRLATKRPVAENLTVFYLWLALGGCTGSLLNTIVAPHLFAHAWEYPLMYVAACCALPQLNVSRPARDLAWLALVLACVAAGVLLGDPKDGTLTGFELTFIYGIPALVCFLRVGTPLVLGVGVAAMLWGLHKFSLQEGMTEIAASRNFFGTKLVVRDDRRNVVAMFHGKTVHGMQSLNAAERREPLAYFHQAGPAGDIFRIYREAGPRAPVAVIGLGAGAMACYAEPEEGFTFYEIDPMVAELARDSGHFSFLSECGKDHRIVVGDGRLTLLDEPDHSFGLMILDAFSSHAVPAHLLTREALDAYLAKLTPEGVLAFHVSNHYVDLEPLLASLAKDRGIPAVIRIDRDKSRIKEARYPSTYGVFTRNERVLAALRRDGWSGLRETPVTEPWTDDFSNVLSVVRFMGIRD